MYEYVRPLPFRFDRYPETPLVAPLRPFPLPLPLSKTFEIRPDSLECAQVPRLQNTGFLARPSFLVSVVCLRRSASRYSFPIILYNYPLFRKPEIAFSRLSAPSLTKSESPRCALDTGPPRAPSFPRRSPLRPVPETVPELPLRARIRPLRFPVACRKPRHRFVRKHRIPGIPHCRETKLCE